MYCFPKNPHQKGCGYHLDMLIVGVMIGVCSVFGLPWCVAATVLCLGHVDSLKMETETRYLLRKCEIQG